MKSKRILITGGAGFVGINLCKRLLSQGHCVICMDDFSTGQRSNVMQFIENDHFELVEHDIACPFSLEVDEIYNLACPASPLHYQKDPIKTLKTSVIGAFNVLRVAFVNKAPILQASTSEVYGNPLVHPQTEDYWGNVNPIGIRSCYDEGKRCAESIFINYAHELNVDVKIIRIFNTYGPYMSVSDNRVIPNFITQALQNKDITIFGSGNQTRSFQYIDDLLDAMLKIMEMPDLVGPINIGNPCEYTINQIAHQIIDLTDSTSKITYLPLPQDDPERRRPSILFAQEKLDWHPKIDLKTGLIKTIKYYENLGY